MQINSKAVYNLIGNDFKGNIAGFSRTLKLSYTTVWRVLSGRSTGSSKFIPALSEYCKAKGLPLFNYVKI